MKTLDETIQDIYQDSKNLFGITLPDQSVLPTPDLSRPDTTIICPEGTIQLDYFCGKSEWTPILIRIQTEKNKSIDTQKMPQSRSTAFPRHQKKHYENITNI